MHVVPVRINEISAGNSIYVNPTYFKKNDWIELYNTTPQPVDVAGMYLTDHLDKPFKFQIPSSETLNTIIPPYGFLVLWADKLSPIQQLHTDFKLEDEGGLVMLISADHTWSDTLFYPSHAGYESVGLYPNGGMNAYIMNVPTLSSTNQWSSYVQYIRESDLPTSTPATEITKRYLHVTWENGRINLWGTPQGHVGIDLFHISGIHIIHTDVTLENGYATLTPDGVTEGIYIVRLRNEKEGIYCQKIIVK